MGLKELVKGDVKFVYARDGALWYRAEDGTLAGFVFPVPFQEVAGATFRHRDRGIIFMRWIRRYLELLQEEKDMAAAAAKDRRK